MLGTGLLTYLLSKEIYVINHETFAAASIGIVIVYGIKKFGPSVAAFADKLNDVGTLFCIAVLMRMLTGYCSPCERKANKTIIQKCARRLSF